MQQIGMTMFPTVDTDQDPAVDPMNCLKSDPQQFDTATLIQFRRQLGSSPAYTVPAGGGVVTAWSHMGPDPIGFADTMALQMLRPVTGNQFKVIGQSEVKTIFNGPNSFPTRIPVQAGDVVGVFVQHPGNVAYCQEQAPMFNEGDKTREIDGTQNPAVGTTLDFAANEQSARLDVAAMVEPDKDGDGFGDESQDNCAGKANPDQADADKDGVGDACEASSGTPGETPGGTPPDAAAPDTTLGGKGRVKTKAKSAKVKFTFSSTEAGATFMCRLDARPFTACKSPLTIKAKLGTHIFTVVAIDAAGNADPTSAAKQFKVVASMSRR